MVVTEIWDAESKSKAPVFSNFDSKLYVIQSLALKDGDDGQVQEDCSSPTSKNPLNINELFLKPSGTNRQKAV